MNDSDLDKPATKGDLDKAIQEFKTYILEREIKTLRWTTGVLFLYFFGTLASVWFLISQQSAHLSQLLQHWKP